MHLQVGKLEICLLTTKSRHYALKMTGTLVSNDLGGAFHPFIADPGFSVYIGLPTGCAYPLYAGFFGFTTLHLMVDGSAPTSQWQPPSPVLPSLISLATLVSNCFPFSNLIAAYFSPCSPVIVPVSVTTGTGPCGGFLSPLYTAGPG
jgi:hypothetical protein